MPLGWINGGTVLRQANIALRSKKNRRIQKLKTNSINKISGIRKMHKIYNSQVLTLNIVVPIECAVLRGRWEKKKKRKAHTHTHSHPQFILWNWKNWKAKPFSVHKHSYKRCNYVRSVVAQVLAQSDVILYYSLVVAFAVLFHLCVRCVSVCSCAGCNLPLTALHRLR